MPEPLRICGVDVGNTTCWCVFRVDEPLKPAFACLVRERKEPMRVYLNAVAAMTRTICQRDGVLWCERPMGAYHRTIFQQGMLIGALQIGLGPRWSFDLVSPGEWKRLCGLPGDAAKVEVQDWARGAVEHLPDPFTEHMADALGVATACSESGKAYGEGIG